MSAAQELIRVAREGGHIALSGGGTPRRAYELAAELEPRWDGVELWWADERCVPPEHELSNFRLVRETLLDRLERPPRAVHRIQGELEAEAAAAAYERELAGVTLDLALLGIGDDGHTASLFPHAPELAESERLAVAAEPRHEPFVDRVTLTLPMLRAARAVVFLVVGRDKAEVVPKAFRGDPDPATPSSLVRSETGRTLVVLDEAAARMLSS